MPSRCTPERSAGKLFLPNVYKEIPGRDRGAANPVFTSLAQAANRVGAIARIGGRRIVNLFATNSRAAAKRKNRRNPHPKDA